MAEVHLNEEFFNVIVEFKRDGTHFAKRDNIGALEYVVLHQIYFIVKEKGKARVAEIMDYINVSKSSLSQVLRNIEKKGYVKRSISEKDKRGVDLILTDEGLKVCEKNQALFNSYIDVFIERFGVEDTKTLIHLLKRMKATVDEIFEEKKEK